MKFFKGILYTLIVGWLLTLFNLFYKNNSIVVLLETFLMILAIGVHVLQTKLNISKSLTSRLLLGFLLISLMPSLINISSNPFSLFSYNLIITSCYSSLILVLLVEISSDSFQKELLIQRLCLIFLVFVNAFFIILNFGSINEFDQSRHTYNAFQVYDILLGNHNLKFFNFITYYDFYQPLVYFVSVPFQMVLGKSYASVVLSLPLFWLILGYHFLNKYLKEFQRLDSISSNAVTFIFIGGAFASSMTKQFMLDLPCLVMVILFYYYLSRSYFLKNTKWAIVTGIVFGLGILTKSNFLLICIVPISFAIIRGLYKSFLRIPLSGLFIKNIFYTIFAIFMFGGFWYFINFSHYNYTLPEVTVECGKLEGDPKPLSLDSFLWYFQKFPDYFGWILLATILLGIGLVSKKINRLSYWKIISVLSLVVILTVGIITWNKDMRTIFPALFFILPFIIAVIKNINKKTSTYIIIINIAIVFIIQNAYVFNNSLYLENILFPKPYTLQNIYQTPEVPDFKEMHYVRKHYLNSLGYYKGDNPYNVSTNVHTDLYYHNYLRGKNFDGLLIKFDSIFFLKDKFWNDYYFLAIKEDSNIVSFDLKGVTNMIGGDLVIKIEEYDSLNNVKVSELKISKTNTNIYEKTMANSRLRLFPKVHHVYPTYGLVSFYYKLIGINYYDNFNIPLLLYNRNQPSESVDFVQIFNK